MLAFLSKLHNFSTLYKVASRIIGIAEKDCFTVMRFNIFNILIAYIPYLPPK